MSAAQHTPGRDSLTAGMTLTDIANAEACAAAWRLSEKQREFLATIAQSETPTDDFPQGLPLYLSHRFMEFKFNTDGERQRWYRNLETRGLITLTGNGRCFARLTDAGRAAIAKATGSAA